MSEVKTHQPSKVLPISVGAVSEIGQREQNQDSMSGFSSPFGAVYLVADGMGGHRGGAEASRMVVEAFSRHLLAAPESSPVQDALTLAVRLANIEVLEKGKSGNPDFEGMGSTVAIALIREGNGRLELITAHIGDSRIYLQRGQELTQLTKDHTQVQWLVDNRSIDEASARTHPDASILTRAIGHTTDLQVDISNPIPLLSGDGILLCSDGLSGFVGKEEIQRTIQDNPDPAVCASQLVQLALAAGSNDNITVQFLRIGNMVQSPIARPFGRASRKTQPDSAVSSRTFPLSNRWLLAACFLVIFAASATTIWWLRGHKPAPPAADSTISGLVDKNNALQQDTAKLHDDADHAEQRVEDDLANLKGLGDGTGKKPRGDQASLKTEFDKLCEKFERIVQEADNMLKNRETHSRLLAQAPGWKAGDKKSRIDKINTELGTDQTNLTTNQESLKKAVATLERLEARMNNPQTDRSAPAAAGDKKGKGRDQKSTDPNQENPPNNKMSSTRDHNRSDISREQARIPNGFPGERIIQ
jgi:serine/threonine protein phosphatase PrpC